MIVNRSRINAFKSALLNTVVRAVRPAFEGLTLSNCLESEEFKAAALVALRTPFLSSPVEPAMEMARLELLWRIES